MTGAQLLLAVLRQPRRLGELDEAAWDRLIPVARAQRLLARFEPLARPLGLWEGLPERARRNIQGSLVLVEYQQRQVLREWRAVQKALAASGVPLVLLKGAAYLRAGLPPGPGRMLSDLDLLVPQAALSEVEQVLQAGGWRSEIEDAYDQRYYREWMHELPPMRHQTRTVEVDIHHNLLPLTGRYRVPAEALWEAVRTLPSGERVLAPADMLLHCAAHLLVSDELRGGLRDLFDLHQLYLHFTTQESDFAGSLEARARTLGLGAPLWHALSAARSLFGTPVAPRLLDPAVLQVPGPTWRRQALQNLFLAVLRPREIGAPPQAFRQWLLYVRSHWIRMPPGLLVRHLARKGWRRRQGERKSP